jgi:hypothetical protein
VLYNSINCYYAGFYYVECCVFTVMLRDDMLSVVMLTVFYADCRGAQNEQYHGKYFFLIFVIETPFVVNKLACLLEQATSL